MSLSKMLSIPTLSFMLWCLQEVGILILLPRKMSESQRWAVMSLAAVPLTTFLLATQSLTHSIIL